MVKAKQKAKPNTSRTRQLKDIPNFDRPREKMMARGPQALSNLELVAVLLGTGVRGRGLLDIAQELSDTVETHFSQLTLDTLQQVKGVGPVKSCQVLAAVEFSRRFLVNRGVRIKTHKDVLPLVEDLRDKKQEHFLTFTLDGGNMLIEKRTVFVGTLNQSLVHPREIFADAINDRAAALICVHNHPSADVFPSKEDILVTNRLRDVAKLIGIELLDHIIVNTSDHFSFKKKGLLAGR
jgi:DNA repair protein RadC